MMVFSVLTPAALALEENTTENTTSSVDSEIYSASDQTQDENITYVYTRVWDQTVYYGTPLSELNLPERAEVSVNYSSSREVDVDWTNSGYDPESPGEQTLTGILILGEHMTNTNNYAVTAKVNVYAPNVIVSYTGLDETIGVFDASKEEVAKLLEALDPLPKESVVTIGDGRTLTVPIIWDKENIIRTPSFESDKFARDYRVKGRLDFSGVPNLSSVPDVEATFTMYDWWTQAGKIMSFMPLPELSVEKKTTKAELLNIIKQSIPTSVCRSIASNPLWHLQQYIQDRFGCLGRRKF